MGIQMVNDAIRKVIDPIATKAAAVLFSAMMTLIMYFIKDDLTKISSTLNGIQTEMIELSRENVLLKQRFEMGTAALEDRMNLKIESLEDKIKEMKIKVDQVSKP